MLLPCVKCRGLQLSCGCTPQRAAHVRVTHAHALGNVQVLTAKGSMSGGVLQYAPASQSLDGGAFSAFIMAAMLDAQVLWKPSTVRPQTDEEAAPASAMAFGNAQCECVCVLLPQVIAPARLASCEHASWYRLHRQEQQAPLLSQVRRRSS